MIFDNDLNFLSVINIQEDSVNEQKKMFNTTEAFIKGNVFIDEYKPYNKMIPKVPKTTCEKTARLYKIMELNFVINDLNLWLDIHPNDELVFNDLKRCIEALCEIEAEYVKKYGPIEVMENTGDVNKWVTNWPWEKEDSLYV